MELLKGDDYLEKDADHRTYEIDVKYEPEEINPADVRSRDRIHWAQIVVYGNPELRDAIIMWMNHLETDHEL